MSTAIFTIVQNDIAFTKRWVEYHSRFFDEVYVLEHGSEGAAEDTLESVFSCNLELQVIPVHHPYSYDAPWMAMVVRDFHAFLTRSYDAVAFVAVDEFLATRRGTLSDWLAAFTACEDRYVSARAARAAGYEVVHWKDKEPALDWSEPWLPQRRWWYPSRQYSKPVISTSKIFWQPGFSDATNASDAVDPELLLLHLHRIDYDECLRKHREACAREWMPYAKNEGPFRQNRVEDPEALSRWLLCNSDDTLNYATLEAIPGAIKLVV